MDGHNSLATSIFPKKALALVGMSYIQDCTDSVRPPAVQIALQKVARNSFESVGHKTLRCEWLGQERLRKGESPNACRS